MAGLVGSYPARENGANPAPGGALERAGGGFLGRAGAGAPGGAGLSGVGFLLSVGRMLHQDAANEDLYARDVFRIRMRFVKKVYT